MHASTNPTVIALADQMEAARLEASQYGNRELLRDTFVANCTRLVCRGLTTFGDELSYDPETNPYPTQRAVLVRGDWTADLFGAIDAGATELADSYDAMYADEIPDNGDVLSDLEMPGCRRCWDIRGSRSEARSAERVIWVHGGGRTVVEFAFCRDCAGEVDREHGPLSWRR